MVVDEKIDVNENDSAALASPFMLLRFYDVVRAKEYGNAVVALLFMLLRFRDVVRAKRVQQHSGLGFVSCC